MGGHFSEQDRPDARAGTPGSDGRVSAWLLPTAGVLLDTDLADTFEHDAPGGWRLVVVARVLDGLIDRAAGTGTLAPRARTVLRLLNDAARQPPAAQRLVTEASLDHSPAMTDSVQRLLAAAPPGTTVLLLALTDAEQLLLRPLFAPRAGLVTVGGLRDWAHVTGRTLAAVSTPNGAVRSGAAARPPFRVRSQRAVAAAGYAALLVATLGLPPALWASQAPWLPGWPWLLGSLLLSVGGVGLLRWLGQAFSGTRLACLTARLDGALPPRHRAAYWLGLLCCTAGSAGLFIPALALCLWWTASAGDEQPG